MGYPTPNQKEDLKLFQYADDINFFIIIEDSIVKILKFFKQYKIETGAIIIISKTTITPLANAKINNLDKKIKNIQINNPKILSKSLASTLTMI